MKILILLLLTFNSFASTKFVMRDLRNNSIQGEDIFNTQELAVARLIEIAKVKNGWRTGEFNNAVMDSLYSKQFKSYDENGFENGTETKYYHPVNWSYSFSDATEEVLDKAIGDSIEKNINCGNSTIRFVAKSNVKKNLSKGQRKQMVSTYSEIFDLLKSGSVDIAKDEIALITADGTIVTDQDKTDTIEFITGCE